MTTHDEIINDIKGWNNRYILDKNYFIKENNKLTNFESYTISASMPMDSNPFGIDTNILIKNTLKNEILQNINKRVMIQLFSSKYFEYLDLTSKNHFRIRQTQ